MASLSSYCQYPLVKTIGKDTVVIMTIKQGQEINQKFSSLNDSITILNKNLSDKKIEINLVEGQKKSLDSTLSTSLNKIFVSDKEIEKLNKTIVDNDNRFWREKKTWVGWMLLSFVTLVLVGSLK